MLTRYARWRIRNTRHQGIRNFWERWLWWQDIKRRAK